MCADPEIRLAQDLRDRVAEQAFHVRADVDDPQRARILPDNNGRARFQQVFQESVRFAQFALPSGQQAVRIVENNGEPSDLVAAGIRRAATARGGPGRRRLRSGGRAGAPPGCRTAMRPQARRPGPRPPGLRSTRTASARTRSTCAVRTARRLFLVVLAFRQRVRAPGPCCCC